MHKEQQTIYKNIQKKNRQTFLNINSEHPKSLKASIPYSLALGELREFVRKQQTLNTNCKNLKKDL